MMQVSVPQIGRNRTHASRSRCSEAIPDSPRTHRLGLGFSSSLNWVSFGLGNGMGCRYPLLGAAVLLQSGFVRWSVMLF